MRFVGLKSVGMWHCLCYTNSEDDRHCTCLDNGNLYLHVSSFVVCLSVCNKCKLSCQLVNCFPYAQKNAIVLVVSPLTCGSIIEMLNKYVYPVLEIVLLTFFLGILYLSFPALPLFCRMILFLYLNNFDPIANCLLKCTSNHFTCTT